MFALTLKTTEPTLLEEELDRLLTQMKDLSPETDEYAKIADQLSKLYKLKETDSKKRVSPDTLATIAGSLTSVLLIVGYEHGHVMTSKALGFVGKLVK